MEWSFECKFEMLYFIVKKTNARLGTILNFLFYCKKTNGHFDTTVNFAFRCKKKTKTTTTNSRLGTIVKFRISS